MSWAWLDGVEDQVEDLMEGQAKDQVEEQWKPVGRPGGETLEYKNVFHKFKCPGLT